VPQGFACVPIKRMPIDDSFHFPPACACVLERCWRTAAAPAAWNLSEEQFQRLLERSASKKFSGKVPDHKALESYLDSLHVADLALAGACGAGNGAAWDIFVERHRPELYRAARAIAGESQGRELADSLYTDLFGLRESEGRRKSLFEYFHGRSKLGTWLRAVLAQRHVDEIRRASRTESLDEPATDPQDEVAVARESSLSNVVPDPDRARFLAMLQAALTTVLSALDSRDRLRLAYYYVHELTLAQIGKLLGEHEATVSRKLDRTRHDVRKRVETSLREEKKLGDAQLLLCLEYAREEWPFDLTRVLSSRG
jgi:RNA polymerase sigma-70 factor (ECF subfamily)